MNRYYRQYCYFIFLFLLLDLFSLKKIYNGCKCEWRYMLDVCKPTETLFKCDK